MRLKSLAAAVALSLWLGGCTKSLDVIVYPPFYQGGTVAVAPFDNFTLNSSSGMYVSKRLAGAIASSGAYQVVTPEDLLARLGPPPAAATQPAPGQSPGEPMITPPPPPTQRRQEVLARLRQIGGIDYLIEGRVYTLSSAGRVYRWIDEGWGYRRYWVGNDWYYPVNFYGQSVGVATVEAEMIRVSDGAVVARTPGNVSASYFSSGDPPPLTPDQALARATDDLIEKLLRQFGPAQTRLRLKPNETLRVGTGEPPTGQGDQPAAGTFMPTDKFAPGQVLAVLVTLPADAARNTFSLRVHRGKDVVAEQEILWPTDQATVRVDFDTTRLYEAGGPGDYQVILRSPHGGSISRKVRIQP